MSDPAYTDSPDWLASYVEAWRGRASCEAAAAALWRRQVAARLPAFVELLVKRYGVTKVVLFGSFARGEAAPGSDLDLLVEGLPMERLIEATVALERLLPHDITLDLVPAEQARPEVLARIAGEGYGWMSDKKAARLQLLAAELRAEVGRIARTVAEIEEACVRVAQPDGPRLLLYGAAALLETFYSGVEKLLTRIAGAFGGMPDGHAWYRRLLEDAALDLPKLRPPSSRIPPSACRSPTWPSVTVSETCICSISSQGSSCPCSTASMPHGGRRRPRPGDLRGHP
jgi:predicted nucleotidyltransferase